MTTLLPGPRASFETPAFGAPRAIDGGDRASAATANGACRPPARRIVGSSAALRGVLDDVARVAPTDAPVLILGETGTGKELLARALHEASRRAQRPLVRIDCSSLSATLSESELFGHLRGAFTGALTRRVGRVELAHRGTLFLDEIGELAPELQAKLLRVLQEGEFEPLGSSETVRVDLRVIAATHRPLPALIAGGAFRADLYHRLAAFVVRVPALRDRCEDIPELVAHLVAQQAQRLDRPFARPAPEIMRALMQQPWPGNVRELQNAVQRACILANGPSLAITDFGIGFEATVDASASAPIARAAATTRRTLRDVEREHIRAVLHECGGAIEGQAGAARILGLPPSTLRFRIRKLGIAAAPPVERLPAPVEPPRRPRSRAYEFAASGCEA